MVDAGLPAGDHGADRVHLERSSARRASDPPVDPGDVMHRVAPAAPRAAPRVRARAAARRATAWRGCTRSRLLLDEAVAARHPDLAQGQVLEHRQHEGAHVPLVQDPSRLRDPALEVDVLQPVRDESPKGLSGVKWPEPDAGWSFPSVRRLSSVPARLPWRCRRWPARCVSDRPSRDAGCGLRVARRARSG